MKKNDMDAICLQIGLCAALLGSSSFDVRERATLALAAAQPHVAGLLAQHDDPEVACRAGRTARDQRRAWAISLASRLHPKQFKRTPWIDGLHRAGNYGQTVSDYLVLANEQRQANWGQWWNYRVACELWLRDCLIDGVPVSELQRLLDICGEAELQWIMNNPGSLPDEVK